MGKSGDLFEKYRDLQAYVGWTDEDVERVRAVAPLLEPHFPALVEDFYEEIKRHPRALRVITGGEEQIERLKGTLTTWLRELVSGEYDADYVARRWRVGWRHVEIGLDQVFTNMAMSRLRTGLVRTVQETCLQDAKSSPAPEDKLDRLVATVRSLNKLLDLDLAIIEDAYQAEYLARQQQVERLATIGQVAGGVAHELRNPLNVIKTSVYYLLNARRPSPEKVRQHLDRIEKQVGMADGVITALSSFARLPLPNLEPIDVEAFLREAIEAAELREGIETVVECPAGLPAALGDAGQLHIVLSNLIRNARDAMSHGGLLTIAAHDEGGHVAIDVRDTGEGIAPEHLDRIMEPLFSTKARGIGLGLALARAILEKNGGRLSVHSEPGRGATFTIHLQSAQQGNE